MRHYDLSPLYRSSVGFDRLFSLLDGGGHPDNSTSYPPYNIERTAENAYRITMAIAGFGESDISIEVKEGSLLVLGEKTETETDNNREFLHQGIASRAFERRFQLADHVEVKGASLEHGLLHIDLEREIPEALKPRSIAITTAKSNGKVLEGSKA